MMLINGQPAEQISAHDRGLHYGDGLFETIAVKNGIPLLWERHMLRLNSGCSKLGIPQPDYPLLRAEAHQICAGAEQAVLKIIITRGAGGRGYRPSPLTPHASPATRIVARYPWPEWPQRCWQEGVRVRICQTPLGINPLLAGIKHLNRLEQVLARTEWDDPDIPEGLMLDQTGSVIEATQSNLFIVKGGRLLTPDLSSSGVAGIMRACIIEIAAKLSIPCTVTRLTLTEVQAAEEAFLCNSLIAVWPIRVIAGTVLKPGPITALIYEHIQSYRE
ncbi:MAG: aminodeoxychorismate lyase [Gammaproteobacteria bacterium]|nr:aminodeoxychorismate lyase [Gammaproteobacteria bacterium]